MGGAGSTFGREEKFVQHFRWKKQDYLKDLGGDGG
jgi:hypothetical protein